MLIEPQEKAFTWSYVGKDAAADYQVKLYRPTMELDLSQFSPHLLESIVIHEFGRALGLENEHQRPDFWDVVEDHLNIDQMKEDRGDKDFEFNLYQRDIQESVNYLTDYDPDSIMHCQ